jgi:hypothetical protein
MTSEVEARSGHQFQILSEMAGLLRITSESNGIHEVIILGWLNRRT